MVRLFSVKLLLVWMVVLGSFANAQEEQPDPRELLKSARVAQANMDWKFTGHLREGASSKKIPFVLTISNGLIRYEFQDNKDAISLRMGDRDTRLEETVAGKTERIGPARFQQAVRQTSLSYEDLAFKFLYWSNARVVGSEKILLRDCWVVEILPPGPGVSQYASVKVWLAKEDNAVMKMETYDADRRMIRKYVVRNVMKRDGYWFLKQMEITGPGSKRPTFLELNDVVN
jgi:hypothetical protein